ncbi:D-alanyl-D-alanine carboxypeptidase family protein [Actibacterium sp. XHP0104]|uniref:D-alanyl-D-alanine carboxypeptidase family protein n=1 Tax=Actibacterium sp. XHP0104 TaxID=2984335 RepID=UPI0021E997EB|nr:D-alanyl-D-alanine carboxypeptidase family protein [Actibacterium sp. XHP0104]MCV2882519.1 D-alanyl-D-alanine carboxypeptidase [Actibacterium sp. XHP0104]
MTHSRSPLRPARLTLAALAAVLAVSAPAFGQSGFDTRARAAYVLDQTTDTVLLSKNSDVALPPASMSKLMTLNMLFEALRDGRVTLDTRFSVSTKAMNMGGSTMFLNDRDRPRVEDLIQGIIVQSGNDACVVVAEGLAGTEEAFAALMTERALALGMENSSFANASGWPHPGQRMSMRDLAVLADHLITDFPEYYHYFGQSEYDFDGRAPQNRFNRNPLLKLGVGADGLKTGHTEEAGYGLVGAAMQGKRRVIVVMSGLTSETERAEEGERLINWAFRQFIQKTVVKGGTRLAEVDIWLGDDRRVGLVVPEDVTLLLPALSTSEVQAELRYDMPVRAPIAEGQKLGELTIERAGLDSVTVPLVAENAVGYGGMKSRLRTAIGALLGKIAAGAQSL